MQTSSGAQQTSVRGSRGRALLCLSRTPKLSLLAALLFRLLSSSYGRPESGWGRRTLCLLV